ncbi:MAG: helix-turn-helix transcriptional regulator [Patescibacteria group bacterium]
MNYSRAIKIIRAAMGISQQEFAQKTSISKSLLSRIESGERKLSKANLKKMLIKVNIPKDLMDLLALEKKEISKISEDEIEKLGKALVKIILLNETIK